MIKHFDRKLLLDAIGWAIFPIGVTITALVLFEKIDSSDLKYYSILGGS